MNLRENQTTGLIELKLIRDDYDENDLPVLDENNILKLVEYNKGSIGSINTEVRVKFIDRVSQYEQRTVIAQNLGAYNEKQTISHVETEYAGFTNARNAQIAAERELIPNNVNVTQVRLECDRSAYDLNVGDPVMFKWKKLGIDAMPIRVMNVDLGTLKKGIIKISLVQDVFGFSRSTYKSNKSDWESVLTKPRYFENVLMMEAPAVLGVQPGRTTVLAAHTSAKNEEGVHIALQVLS